MVTVPVQTAWLSWDSRADRLVPILHLLCLADELGLVEVMNTQAARFPMICSGCSLCRFCSRKARGRGLVLILPLAEKSAWVWGLPHHFCYLLISSSGIFPSPRLSISLFLSVMGCKSRTPLNPSIAPQLERGLCFGTSWVDAYFQKLIFLTLDIWAAQRTRSLTADWGIYGISVLKFEVLILHCFTSCSASR